jgi:intraflagellar transport protein 172
MNYRATKLLFRDKRRHLHVVDIATNARTTLLDYCAYVQWVPESDVVVAQNRGSLCVWYSIDAPSRPTLYPIKGEVLEIERGPDRTEVVVDEGGSTASYALDDALISFGAAVEAGDLARAAGTLDPLELSPEVEAMWTSLAQRALEEKNLAVAERCVGAGRDGNGIEFFSEPCGCG